MKPDVHSTIKGLLNDKLSEIEKLMPADIFSYSGPIQMGTKILHLV